MGVPPPSLSHSEAEAIIEVEVDGVEEGGRGWADDVDFLERQ